MADLLTIDATGRTDVGTVRARRMRQEEDLVPGVVYGGDEPPVHFALEYRLVRKAIEDESFFSQILSLNVDDSSQQVVLREIQRHPATEKVLHIDFLRVREDRELQVAIPVHFLNEEDCVGVKLNGGMISRNLTEVEVSCLPRDLPEYIEIDMGPLDIGDAVHLSEVELPPGVVFVALAHGSERDDQIVSVHMPRGMALDEEEEEALEADEDAEEQEDGQDEETTDDAEQ